jgi:DNA-binding protein YbaB
MNEFANLSEVLKRYGGSSEGEAATRIAAAVNGVRDRFTELMGATVSATDESGQVTATVTVAGRVESVNISAYAIRNLPGSALDRACFDAIVEARKAGAAQWTSQLEELTGQRPDLGQG